MANTNNNNVRRAKSNCLAHLDQIDIEDLEYVERDLCFAEKVSVAFLLYGENHANAAYALQKLLVLAGVVRNSSVSNHNLLEHQTNLLRKYALSQPQDWRNHLVEALVIINARRALRKLGFRWAELRQHYLPHISALSLHIHPVLKALYAMCESLTAADAGRLVMSVNDKYKTNSSAEHFRFYDSSHLEIFLLDWLTRQIINLGDVNAVNSDVNVLIEYFKFNELDALATLLVDTINSNAGTSHRIAIAAPQKPLTSAQLTSNNNDQMHLNVTVGEASAVLHSGNTTTNNSTHGSVQSNESIPPISATTAIVHTLDALDCYTVSYKHAGIALIINQQHFHRNVAEEFQHLLPTKALEVRAGTNVDRDRLSQVFNSYGYMIEQQEDLDHIEMLHHIREVVKRSLLKDSLIVCILSHGIDGAVFGSNSIPVKITDIELIINAADTLQNKPKMLIIQACQKNEANGIKPKTNSNVQLTADAYADMVKAMSTVPGFESMRNTATGTWFIQELCNAIASYGNSKHMLDILTAVTRNVSSKRGDKNEMMTPLTHTTLRKTFYLPRNTA